MKRVSLFLAGMVCILVNAYAQPVRLNNNKNLNFGHPLSATKALFLQQEFIDNAKGLDSLWITDGTVANTVKLNVPVTFDRDGHLFVWNGNMYFTGFTPDKGSELWVTDGTVAGTKLVKDIRPGGQSSDPRAIIAFNGSLYFFANDGTTGMELWKSDGTEAGTVLLKDINTGAGDSYLMDLSFGMLNNELYFTAMSATGYELWKTNGTTVGTVQLKDINVGPESSEPFILKTFNNELYFLATTQVHGQELWKTNGSAVGTVMVRDINLGPKSADISGFTELNGKLLFAASGTSGNSEIWVSDGTEDGTKLLKDIEAGNQGSYPDLDNGIIINEKLIFSASTAATGRELFITDGTTAGTGLFKDMAPGPTSGNPTILLDNNFMGPNGTYNVERSLFRGKIFFSVNINHVDQLWITDGTPAGTVMVKDFGVFGLVFDSHFYTQSGLYFAGNHASAGFEIFKSEGTAATTNLYADINTGAAPSMPFFQFFILNGKVFFTADDGDADDSHRDLYVLGGTEVPLPLQVLNFGAALQNAGVMLDWNTQNELNTSHFEVERSADGLNFSKIGKLNAKGNSHRASYQHLDADALNQQSQKLYYRLKMVDADGKATYSPVVVVQLGRLISNFGIAPNPVSSTLRIQFVTDKKQQAALRIVNAAGQTVKNLSWQASAGQNQQLIPMDQLAPGVYFAEWLLGGQPAQVQRFIKE